MSALLREAKSIRLIVVIPCFNEAKRLDVKSFLDFFQKEQGVGGLFVNDGSTDETLDILNKMALELPGQIHVLHLEKNAGKAEAVRRGFLKGFEMDPLFIGYLDADLAAPLTCILELERLLADGQRDVAIGSRVAMLGRKVERQGIRHAAGRIFATASSFVLQLKIYDTQCGAKLFRLNERLRRVFSFSFTVNWVFDIEIFARFIITGRLKETFSPLEDIAVELPLQEWTAKSGSKLGMKDFLVSAFDLLKIFRIVRCYGSSHPYVKRLLVSADGQLTGSNNI